MKRNILFPFVLFLMLLSHLVYAQVTQIGPFGGYINSISSDSQGRILAATYLGGIFRSLDNGKNWVKITNDTLRADYRSVAVNSTGDIFAGTDGFGMLRSTDDGVTWERIMNAFSSSTITTLAVKADRLFFGSFDGLFYSDDKGNTIKSVNGISTSIDIYSTAVKDNGDLFAGTYYSGAFRSTDNGANWTPINNGIEFNSYITMGFAFTSSGNILTTNGAKVYLSSDGGDNWNDLNAPTDNYLSVAVGSNDNILAAATSKIYRSTNGGTNWDTLSSWPLNTSNISNLFSSGGYIYAGTYGLGVYNSNDNGDTWNLNTNGMTNTHVNEIAGGPNGELYAATSHAGVFYSTNDGETWENRTNNLPGNWFTNVAVNPKTGTVFVAANFDYCYRSTDMGNTWGKMTTLGSTPVVTFEFNSAGEIYTGYFDRFYKSTDDGVTWIQKFPNASPISDIAVGINDYVYLATDGQGVFLSIDGGDNWDPINDGLDDLNIKHIESFNDTTSLKKNTGNCSDATCSTEDKIFEYNGTQWNLSQENIIVLSQFKTAATNGPTGEASLILTAALLYAKDPKCAWDILTDSHNKDEPLGGFAKFPKNNLNKKNESNFDSLEIFIGTNGGGIYKGTFTLTGIEDEKNIIPDKYVLEQNYPNPFNPNTKIRYSIPSSQNPLPEGARGGLVTLKVYDLLGREVATLVNEQQQPGNYEVTFDGSRLASGVYFYRLRAGNFVAAKKLNSDEIKSVHLVLIKLRVIEI